eukprot:2502235-Pyramimonas_sp.AAC.1
MANAATGQQRLLVVGQEVQLRNAAAFETEVLACNEARAERALRRASSEGVGRHLSGGRIKEIMFRRALLWKPQGRRLVLQGIQHAQEGHGARSHIVRGARNISEAIREHWEP